MWHEPTIHAPVKHGLQRPSYAETRTTFLLEAECTEQPQERHAAQMRRAQASMGPPALSPPLAQSRVLGRLRHPKGWTVAVKLADEQHGSASLHPEQARHHCALDTMSNAPTPSTDRIVFDGSASVSWSDSAYWNGAGFLHNSAQVLGDRSGNQSSERVTNNDASDPTGRFL